MPLPTLNPVQIAQPQPVNALMAGQKFRQEFDQSGEKQNWLRAQEGRAVAGEGRAIEDQEMQKATHAITKEATAISTALKAPTSQQKSIYEKMGGTGGVEFVGNKTKFTYPNGAYLEGPSKILAEFSDMVKDDPSWMLHPEKNQHAIAWGKAHGLEINLQPQAPQGTGTGTAKERAAAGMDMSVPEYELYMDEEKIKLKQSYGDLPENVTRQLIEYGSERRGILREINKEEAMLSNFADKEGGFYKRKKAYIDSLKDESKDIKKGMDRLAGKKSEKSDRKQEATDFLKAQGLPQTEANIKHYLDNY